VVFSVTLPEKGPLLVDGSPVAEDATLERLAREALARTPELRAVLQADGAVPHRTVMHVLDVLKTVGIAHIAFGALPPEEKKP
jgi:biopolymer transport protein ExbD